MSERDPMELSKRNVPTAELGEYVLAWHGKGTGMLTRVRARIHATHDDGTYTVQFSDGSLSHGHRFSDPEEPK